MSLELDPRYPAARAFALGFRALPWSDDMASEPGADLRIAAAFRDVLRSWLEPADFAEMRARNVANRNTNVCASHDFCDANMAMQDAFRRVFAAGPLDGRDDMTDAACDLWGRAWDIAKDNYLTAPAMTQERAYEVASQWGSLIRAGDPGACFYSFRFNDGRPVSEAHRLQCLAYLDTDLLPGADGADAAELQALRAYLATCEVRS